MKNKIIFLLLVAILAMSAVLISCGDKETESETESTGIETETQTETETEGTLTVGEDTEEGFGDIHQNNE